MASITNLKWDNNENLYRCATCNVPITQPAEYCYGCDQHLYGYGVAKRMQGPTMEKLAFMAGDSKAPTFSDRAYLSNVIRGKVTGTYVCERCGARITRAVPVCNSCRAEFENYRFVMDYIKQPATLTGITHVLLDIMASFRYPTENDAILFNVTRLLVPGVRVHSKKVIEEYARRNGSSCSALCRAAIDRVAAEIKGEQEGLTPGAHIGITLEVLDEVQPGVFRCKIDGTEEIIFYRA